MIYKILIPLFFVVSFIHVHTTVRAQSEQPVRPKDFKPFVYPSAIVLREKYSDHIMIRAAEEMARVEQINNRSGNYKPTWESLDRHVVPEWYQDAKFGMFVDWGLYGILAYAPTGYPDWYL